MRRGLKTYKKFKAKWHGATRVQDSSSAFGPPCCWIFTTLAYSNTPSDNPNQIHLTLSDAIKLRDGLTKFIDAQGAD